MIESGIEKTAYFFDERYSVLSESSLGAFGPNVGADGRNLTILFLSLNRASLSIRLLKSITEKLPRYAGEILIADNGSESSELAILKDFLVDYQPRWRLLEFGQNYGVAGGRNRAIREVHTDWVMSLDNDIFFVANPLSQIQRDIGVLGCHFLNVPLLNPDQQTLYAFGGNLQTVVQNGRPRLTISTVLKPHSSITAVSEVAQNGGGFLCSFLFGGASVFNRHTFERLGGFDDNMFIGFEDIDFSLRLFREGLKVGSASALALVHDHPKAESKHAEDYEKTRFSRDTLKASARYLEAKYSFVIWGDEIEDWLLRNEECQGFGRPQGPESTIQAKADSVRRPRIALITDTDNWAFSNISRQLLRYLGDRYELKVIPLVQLGELEEARWLRNGCEGYFGEGGASAFGQALLMAEDCDVIHVFWREYLSLIDSPLLQDYSKGLGVAYEKFRDQYIRGKIFSTAVYDHLFLDSEALIQRQSLFKDVATGYYVSSEKLETIYKDVPEYPMPDAVLEDGVDLTVFGPKLLERFDTVGTREVVVGWVGNSKWAKSLGDQKGVHSILIPAIEELRAEGISIRLHLADRQDRYIPHSQMPEYYKEIDLYICTSNIEGTPNPVLESMACGIPIISTDVGIVPQVFGPLQKKFILQERSMACLKEAIRRLIAEPELFRQLSNENLEQIKAWDWKFKAEKFADFFNLLMRRKNRAEGGVRTKICTLPFTTPSMETDGSIRLCSAASIFDYRDETNMGNCRKDGLEAVWRGEKYRQVRETLFSGENLRPYCDSCEYRFDGPAWLLQLHLGLHAYHNGVQSDTVKQLIAARLDYYDEYITAAPKVGLSALPRVDSRELDVDAHDVACSIKPLDIPMPEELIDGISLPIYMDVNTLNRCNVSCVMCPFAIRYDDLGEEKDDYYRLTLNEYRKISTGLRIESIHFVGAYAEPLLNKEIFSLIAYAHQQGSFTAITSNGLALTSKFARRLLEAGLDMLTISLHGARKETAEAVMRGSDFETIVANIRELQRLKQEMGLERPDIYFNYVGMKMNVVDLPEFIDLAADLKVRHVHFIHLIDGDAVVDGSESLTHYPELLLRFVPEAEERARKLGVNLYVSPAYKEIMAKGNDKKAIADEGAEKWLSVKIG
jgi:radical SAM protein with 4Fe4S-binding SPASM domain